MTQLLCPRSELDLISSSSARSLARSLLLRAKVISPRKAALTDGRSDGRVFGADRPTRAGGSGRCENLALVGVTGGAADATATATEGRDARAKPAGAARMGGRTGAAPRRRWSGKGGGSWTTGNRNRWRRRQWRGEGIGGTRKRACLPACLRKSGENRQILPRLFVTRI